MAITNITIKKDRILFLFPNLSVNKNEFSEIDGQFILTIHADFINSVIYLN